MKSSLLIRTWLAASITVLLLAGPTFVNSGVADSRNNPVHFAAVYPKDDVVITGTVKQVEVEGIFWG